MISSLKYITIDKDIRNGQPVLKGTRFPISQVLAEFSSGSNMWEISQDFDLDPGILIKFIDELAELFQTPVSP